MTFDMESYVDLDLPTRRSPGVGSFDADAALDLVTEFCISRDVYLGTKYSVIPQLDRALRIASLIGPDKRWSRIARWSGNDDTGAAPGAIVPNDLRDILYSRFVAAMPDARWLPPISVVSVSRWARFSQSMRGARDLDLGWIVPIHREVLLVPMPTVRYADGSAGVLHDDTGRPAIEWSDGSGIYYLHGTEFGESVYQRIVGHEMTIEAVAGLRNADQRSIALRYLTFEQLVGGSGAQLVDTDARGAGLYRLPLPPRLTRDRAPGYGTFDYFIHRRDAGDVVEWVDPRNALRHKAESNAD
ncbi:hypothetical protein HZU40_15870 [Mycolicibacterium fluoranthenivorans]|uniref:DUF6745 domain-containing protein n=1 Tax=Mycolicibacterium fluoranthenivorans TaxID=258505 RepID=A0A1G4W477_9MYCO|nr:hypothetical protein [Mycolicibacterium fluoranthenivorans]QNJ95561.1 hypothetical protein HZU40_15870 [Mycolicibacterium fluoranthenivorans]SCX16495.1 hypothetical protein SAMN02799620_02300 [Mycolicibacterium fluoranthenivorans]